MNYRTAILTALFAAALLVWVPVHAQAAIPIVPDGGDSPLRLSGEPADGKPLTGNLRLTAGGDVAAFTFLPSDLKLRGGELVVGRQNVTVSGDPALRAGQPKDFVVGVTGISTPGMYEGQIELLQPGQRRAEALVIPVQIDARGQPSLQLLPGSQQLQLALVNCGGWLDCPLGRLLLPASAFTDQRMIYLQNNGQVSATVAAGEVVAVEQQSGYQLTSRQIIATKLPLAVPGHQIDSLPIEFVRGDMPPGHYSGSLYLAVEGTGTQLPVPMDLNVRSGPAIPMLLILLGILLGRLVKYMQERGEAQSKSLLSVDQLEAQADPEDRPHIEEMVERVRQVVYHKSATESQPQVAALQVRLEGLKTLRVIEAKLPDAVHEVIVDARKDIAKAREAFYEEQDQKAAELLLKVKEALASYNPIMREGDNQDPQVQEAAALAEKAGASAKQVKKPAAAPKEASWSSRFRAWRAVISGKLDEVRAETTLSLVRPMLYVVLLIGLVIIGLQSLYVDNGLTFGAKALSDYVVLVVWGLSADVAGSTLSNLRGPGGEQAGTGQ